MTQYTIQSSEPCLVVSLLVKKEFYSILTSSISMKTTITLTIATSALVLSLLTSVGFLVNTSFAQVLPPPMDTTAGTPANDTGAMMGNQTDQTGGGNETQGPLE